jgi:hypothetical protein
MSDDERQGFVVDFNSMSVVFAGGFSVPIVGMIDRFDMETDDPAEAEEILIEMPPEGIVITMLMSDLNAPIEQQGAPN